MKNGCLPAAAENRAERDTHGERAFLSRPTPSGNGNGPRETAAAAPGEHVPAEPVIRGTSGRRGRGGGGGRDRPQTSNHPRARPGEAGIPGHARWAATGPIPAPSTRLSDTQGALASADGHRGVPRADAGAGTPGRGRRRKGDARTAGVARDDRGAAASRARPTLAGACGATTLPQQGEKRDGASVGGDGGSRMGYRGERRASRDTLGSRFPLDRDRTASPLHATHDATERPTPEAPPHHPAVRCLRSRRLSSLSRPHTHRRRRRRQRRRTRSPRGPLPRHVPSTHGFPERTDRPGRRAGAERRKEAEGTGGTDGRSGRARETTTTAAAATPPTHV